MEKSDIRIAKILMYIFAGVVTVVEVILMFFYTDVTIFLFVGMAVLYIPDVIQSFLKKDHFKWIDFTLLMIYLMLAIVNGLILLF